MNHRFTGTIYLSGGGDLEETFTLDKAFCKERILKKVAFIPIAKTRHQSGYLESYRWIVNKFHRYNDHFVEVNMILNLDDIKNINEYSAVYIGGGNTYKLSTLILKHGFAPILETYLEGGGFIYGASAGAVIFGKHIDTYLEERYLSENELNHYETKRGLGWIGAYSILAHYELGHAQTIVDYFVRHNNPILAIPKGVGLVVKNCVAQVVGGSPVTIFEKNREPRLIYKDEKIAI